MAMQIDNVINEINRKYTFRMIAFLILSFPTFQNYSQLQNVLFALVTPNHTCQMRNIKPDLYISKDQCSIIINGSLHKCMKWYFSPEPVGDTMVSEFQLVCDQKYYSDLIMIVWYIPSITSPLTGWLSDKYGRKRITILYLLLETISSIMLAFSPNVVSNMAWRFLLGISASGVTIAYVWLMESVNVKFRNFTGSFFWMYGCIAYMISPFTTYLTKNWRHTQLISIIPSCLYIFIFFVPESPRWLLTSGNRKKAFQSLKTIAFLNNIDIHFKMEDIVVIHENKDTDLRSALKSSVFLYRSIMAILLQLSIMLFYSAVAINMTILSSNIYLSIFLLGLMETPSLFISFFSLRYFKRKTNLLIFGGAGSFLFWLSVFFNNDIYWQSIVRIILGCIAKTSICCVSQTIMIYVTELFPTTHRSFGLVCSQLFSFLSFIGALYINKLSSSYFFLPMTIYLLFMAVSCSLAFYTLPETKGLPFPETLHDQIMLRVNKEEEYLQYMKGKYMTKDYRDDFDDSITPEGHRDNEMSLLTKRLNKNEKNVFVV